MLETQGELDIGFEPVAASPDVIHLLQADHRQLLQLFDEHESLIDADAPPAWREELAWQICTLLEVHSVIEDEIVYPAVRNAVACSRLVDVATIEHAAAHALMSEIQGLTGSDALFDARVTVLGRHVRLHIAQEENELLPLLLRCGEDLQALGRQLLHRRQELLALLQR